MFKYAWFFILRLSTLMRLFEEHAWNPFYIVKKEIVYVRSTISVELDIIVLNFGIINMMGPKTP